jgi:hypothetical protein
LQEVANKNNGKVLIHGKIGKKLRAKTLKAHNKEYL